MIRSLLVVACVLVALAPAGVALGVALVSTFGAGLAVGSGLYGAVGVWMLTADLLPESASREVVR